MLHGNCAGHQVPLDFQSDGPIQQRVWMCRFNVPVFIVLYMNTCLANVKKSTSNYVKSLENDMMLMHLTYQAFLCYGGTQGHATCMHI